jgi:rod shape-determining protein MreD
MRELLSGRFLILVAGLVTLDYTLAAFFPPLGGKPDLLYLVILDYAFFWSWERVPFLALGLGLLRDFFGGHLFGIETLSLTATGFLLSLGTQKLERGSGWVRLVMSFLFIALTELLRVSLGRGIEFSRGLSFELIGSIFWTTIYTMALAPFFFWFTARWLKRIPVYTQYELF